MEKVAHKYINKACTHNCTFIAVNCNLISCMHNIVCVGELPVSHIRILYMYIAQEGKPGTKANTN